jgi:predicted DNA-binding protein (MmcQ/YjbR family)
MDLDAVDEVTLRRLARAAGLAVNASEYADVPAEPARRVRDICLALPEVTENQAWAGTQFRIRKRVFAHVLTVDFADGPVTVLTFRASGPELEALRNGGHPHFRPAWGADAVGRVLDPDATDASDVRWDEVAELVTESYCVVAPKKLVALVDRPSV